MPNSNLKDKIYNHNGEKKTYTSLAMKLSRLKKAEQDCKENNNCEYFKKLGGNIELEKLNNLIKKEQDTDYNTKKIGMDTGRENQFIDNHTKDRDNANPTAIGGIPKVTKGSINRKILTNKEVYNEEINKIRYLIEYIDNFKK
jgi:hypothetical protein